MTLTPHPALHPVFETFGYVIGYLLYRRSRGSSGDILEDDQRWLIIAAAAVGALVGSRVLGILEQVPVSRITWASLVAPGGGKTIVGGLLGGWIAVEVVKRFRHIQSRTGDLFAVPLCVGIAVGRIGCFMAGLADGTYGTPTRLPWGVDYGDGIPRHPVQLYEIGFLAVLGWLLWKWGKRPHAPGILFRALMAAYLAWRLGIDFLKPDPHVAGINMIQWACVAGLIALGASDLRIMRERRSVQPN